MIYQIGVTAVSVLLVVAMIFGLTTAWYSNIIQMSALTVQTETWNFSGTIKMTADNSETAIAAAPGDSGVIGFSITNGDTPVNIRLDVKKDLSADETLAEKMQKRIYCYVEDTDGSRTYLNSQSYYIYGPISQNATWNMKKDEGDKPILYWQWVYDVLGYYVLGTVKAKTVTKEDSTQEIVPDASITDYLMPVEYDLDTATFNAVGNLDSITRPKDSGSKTVPVEDYLKELFQAYKQTAEYVPESAGTQEKPATVRIGNYYAVDIDENGQGVWLYLCNSEEIQKETAVDTELSAETAAFNLTLTFTGQNAP